MHKLPTIIGFEGLDAVGKETLAKYLCRVCEENNLFAKVISFPRYETTWGKAITGYLQGELGNPVMVNPIVASSLYTADRINYFKEHPLDKEDADVIILDRSFYSNFIHQASKFQTPSSVMIWMLENYFAEFKQIKDFEAAFWGIFYLQLDEESRELQMKNRTAQDGHEKNIEYQKRCQAFIDQSRTEFFKNSLFLAAQHMSLLREESINAVHYYCGEYINIVNVKYVEDSAERDKYLDTTAHNLFNIAQLGKIKPKIKLTIDPKKTTDMSNALNILEEVSDKNG